MADGGKVVIKIDGDDSGFKKAADNVKKAGAAIGAAAVAGLGAAVKVGMDFEAQMSKVGAISMASAADMEILSQKAKEMGETTVFSASQAGEAFEYMAMAGWKTEEMTSGIAGIMDLAAASGENLGTVSDIVTDALTAFGLTAEDSGHFADVLAAASSNANTNVSMMGETFKYVAPLAGSLGYSVEDTAVAIGLMANAGIKGSQAGTSLRSILTRLAKPPKEAATAMKKLGLSITDTSGNIKPFNALMKEMRTAFSKLDDAQKPTYAAMLGGQEAMSGLLAIVNAGEKDFDKLSSAVENANGTAAEMAERNLDNLKGKLTLAGSAAEALGIAVYEGIEEPLKNAAEKGTEYIQELTEKVKDPVFLQNVKEMAVGIGVVSTAVVGYKTATVAATAAQALFNTTLTLNPIGLTVAGITGLAAGFVALENSVNGAARSVRNEREAYEELTAATAAEAEQNTEQINRASALAEELNNITNANGHVKSGYEERAKYILGELSQATGEEYTMTGNLIDKYGELSNSIDTLLMKKKAEVLGEGVTKNFSEATAKAEEYSKKLAELSGEYDILDAKIEQGEKLSLSEAARYGSLRGELEETKKSFLEYTNDSAEYGNMLAELEAGNYDEFVKMYRSKATETKNYTDGLLSNVNSEQTALMRSRSNLEELKKSAEELGQTAAAEEFAKQIADIDTQMRQYAQEMGFRMDELAVQMLDAGEGAGTNIDAGIAKGISSSEAAKKAASASAWQILGCYQTVLNMHSPSRAMRDKVGKMITAGIAVGIDDGKTEVQKVIDDMGEEMLESEKFYAAESARIEREKEEAEYAEKLKNAKTAAEIEKIKQEKIKEEAEQERKDYLEGLKQAADRERKIYEALQKDIEKEKKSIVDNFTEMAEAAFNSIEELEDGQSQMSDKLKSFGNLYYEYSITGMNANGKDETMSGIALADLSKQNDILKQYKENLLAVKERGELPKEFFSQIRDMSVEEGLQFTNALLDASDSQFDKYVNQWKDKQSLAEQISKELFADDTAELKRAFEDRFGELPENFFELGEDSAERYGEGFMEQLRTVWAQVRDEINACMQTMLPAAAFAVPGGNVTNTEYTSNYYVQPVKGESTREQIEAFRNYETYKKMQGGY